MPCKRKFTMRAAKTQDGSKPHEYKLQNSPFQIKKIICYSSTPVPVQLLAIEEKRNRDHKDACVYNKREKIDACCIRDAKSFAHIYISTESKKAFVKHFIVAFVERRNMENYNDLVKILLDTVNWLKIKNDRPHFYIFYNDCSTDNLAIMVAINNIRDKIIDELIGKLSYPKKLYGNNYGSICKTESVRRDATAFAISSNSPAVPYRFETTNG